MMLDIKPVCVCIYTYIAADLYHIGAPPPPPDDTKHQVQKRGGGENMRGVLYSTYVTLAQDVWCHTHPFLSLSVSH